VQVWAERIGQRPAGEIPPDHALVRLAVECLEKQGISPVLGIGSTDANIPLSMGLPAICVGLTQGSGSHTLNECMNIQPLVYGLKMLAELAKGIFQRL
jgi:di/tripeptidase